MCVTMFDISLLLYTLLNINFVDTLCINIIINYKMLRKMKLPLHI